MQFLSQVLAIGPSKVTARLDGYHSKEKNHTIRLDTIHIVSIKYILNITDYNITLNHCVIIIVNVIIIVVNVVIIAIIIVNM